MTVRVAVESDRERIAAMLARAFHDDPAYAYVFPDSEDRAVRLPRLFRLLFDSDGRAGLCLTAGEGAAATLWRAPGRAKVGWGEMLRHAGPLMSALGGNVARALRVSAAIDAHMPGGAFWYLHCVGCEPARQGTGLGAAAVRAGFKVAGKLPIYLETATEANVRFYKRIGFAVTAEWRVGRRGPCFWSMMRFPAVGI